MELNETEINSELWKKLETYAINQLQLCRANNDHDVNENTTNWNRGRISAIKDFLSLNPDWIDE